MQIFYIFFLLIHTHEYLFICNINMRSFDEMPVECDRIMIIRILKELSNASNITNIYFVAYDLQCIHCRMQYMHVDINIEFKIYNVTIIYIILYGFFLSLLLSIFLLNFFRYHHDRFNTICHGGV